MYKVIYNFKDRLILELTPRGDLVFRSLVDNVEAAHEFTLAQAAELASKIFQVINEDPQLVKKCGDQVALAEKLKTSPAAGLHDHGFEKMFTVDEVNNYIVDEIKKAQGYYVKSARRRRKFGRY